MVGPLILPEGMDATGITTGLLMKALDLSCKCETALLNASRLRYFNSAVLNVVWEKIPGNFMLIS